MGTGSSDWATERTAAAHEHQKRLRARRQVEHAQAAAILAEFAAVAPARLPPQPLVIRGYGGHGCARSTITGWYLRIDRTLAVGIDGQFYVLTAHLRLLDRFRRLELHPSPAPLVIGAGGRDGDTIALEDALERLLPGWRSEGTPV
ncbi:MAG: hypothetical protein ACK5KU_07335 [Beutenbergiaceae bacterium]